MAQAPQIQPEAIPVPSAFKDRPMFLTQGQLLRLRDDPDSYSRVGYAKTALAESLLQTEVWRHIADRIASTGAIELSGGFGGLNHRLVVRADRFERGRFFTNDRRPVEIQEFDGDRPVRRITAAKVITRSAVGSRLSNPTIDLVVHDCQVTDLRQGAAVNQRAELKIPALSLPDFVGADPSLLPYEPLLARAEGSGGLTRQRAENLTRVVVDLRLDIDAALLRRYALSVTGMLLLLLGATLAMWLRDSLPLVTYIWAFLPSILDVGLISGGDNMVREGIVVAGYAVMWSCNALLLLLLLYILARLMRN